MNTPMRLVLANLASATWMAGGYYQKNLLAALRAISVEVPIHLTLLTDQKTPQADYELLLPYLDQVICAPETRFFRLIKSFYLRFPFPNSVEHLLLPRQILTNRLRALNTHVVFSNDEYGPQFKFPLLSWIPDFQHLHLPELFTKAKTITRNNHNDRIAKFADRVILSSQNAKQDFIRISPKAAAKARVLHFAVKIPDSVYHVNPTEICHRYSLPEYFFFLPNQFWPHKNHLGVLDALDILWAREPSIFKQILIVCSGNPNSLQGMDTFNRIMGIVSERGYYENFRYLGIIPHEDVLHLMRKSLAVIQPSLFEGWSTTVEEARSLGKLLILSDIDVHREQDPPSAVYFDPRSPQMLADTLSKFIQEGKNNLDLALERDARYLQYERILNFGRQFMQIAEEARQ